MAETVQNETLLRWMWLQRAIGPGSRLVQVLFDAFGQDIDRIYEAERKELEAIPKLNAERIEKLAVKDLSEEMTLFAHCRNEGIAVLTLSHAAYPMRLRKIASPPLVLYVRGQWKDFEKRLSVSVVGTRRMSEYGNQQTYLLSHDMAKAGTVIVSGMAKGVDGTAHRACLDAGGYTVAVLGCGVDKVYPPEHGDLMQEIIHHGAVISEFPPFSPPRAEHFPMRNRIISGLSEATLVTEADDKSGALITARTAVMQGRMVFALPGKVGEQGSRGVNELLRGGAHIVTSAHDVLRHFEGMYEGLSLSSLPDPGLRSRTSSPIKRKTPHPTERVLVDTEAKIEQGQARIEVPTPEPIETAKIETPRTAIIETVTMPVLAPEEKPVPKPERSVKPKKPAKSAEPPKRRLDINAGEFLFEVEQVEKRDERAELTEYQRQVCERVPFDAFVAPDEIIGDDPEVRKVVSALTMLEIHGYVEKGPGGYYKRIP